MAEATLSGIMQRVVPESRRAGTEKGGVGRSCVLEEEEEEEEAKLIPVQVMLSMLKLPVSSGRTGRVTRGPENLSVSTPPKRILPELDSIVERVRMEGGGKESVIELTEVVEPETVGHCVDDSLAL